MAQREQRPAELPTRGAALHTALQDMCADLGYTLWSRHEMMVLDRVFASCQESLARPATRMGDLLAAVRDAIGSDRVFLLVQRGTDVEVTGAEEAASHRLARRGRLLDRDGRLAVGTLRKVVSALGAPPLRVATGVGRVGPQAEALLAGWAVGPVLSAETMTLLARTISMARSALDARRRDVTEVVDKERIRMAEELHDGLTQIVAGAVLELEALRNRIERDPAAAIATLDNSKGEMRRALADIRDVLFDLSQAYGERPAPHDLLTHNVDDIVERWRLPARVAVAGDLSRVPARTLSVAHVVIREALTNAAKHAAATNVTVSLSANDAELKVVVGDAGSGFSGDHEQDPRQARHFGLAMLRRRVREAGGSLTVHSRPGKGTRVIARLPTREVAS